MLHSSKANREVVRRFATGVLAEYGAICPCEYHPDVYVGGTIGLEQAISKFRNLVRAKSIDLPNGITPSEIQNAMRKIGTEVVGISSCFACEAAQSGHA